MGVPSPVSTRVVQDKQHREGTEDLGRDLEWEQRWLMQAGGEAGSLQGSLWAVHLTLPSLLWSLVGKQKQKLGLSGYIGTLDCIPVTFQRLNNFKLFQIVSMSSQSPW